MDLDHNLNRAIEAVMDECDRIKDRPFPGMTDPVRSAALVCEEAGELIKAALDLTRGSTQPNAAQALERAMYREAVQTAAIAVYLIMAMERRR